MRDLAQRVHAGIGAARAVHRDLLAAEPGDRGFERLPAPRTPFGLALPADEARCRHIRSSACSGARQHRPGRRSESRAGNRRRRVAPGRAAAAAVGRSAPSPQAIVRRSSSTVPGGAAAGQCDGVAASTAADRPRSVRRDARKYAPGHGSNARTCRSRSTAGSRQSSRPSSRPSLRGIGDAVRAAAAAASAFRGRAVERVDDQPAAERGQRGRESGRRRDRDRSASPPAAASGRYRAPRPSA